MAKKMNAEDSVDSEAMRKELKECQSTAQAAKLALALLQEKDTLKAEYAKCRQQFTAENEQLREENYSLSQRLTTKSHLLEQYSNELDAERNEKSAADSVEKERVRVEHEHKLAKMRKKHEETESELIEAKLTVERLTSQLTDARIEMERARRRARMSDDSLDNSSRNRSQEQLRLELGRLNSDYEVIVQELKSVSSETHNLRCENAELKRELENETSRADEFQGLSSQFRKETEELRDRLAFLTNELETARGSQKTARKGNSMFAELDDHRRLMERNILTLKEDNEQLMARNAELEREIQVQQQHLMVALQVSEGSGGNSRAVVEELTRLRGENRALNSRLSQRMPNLGALSNDQSAGAMLADTDRLSKDMIASLRVENERLQRQTVRLTTERDRCRDDLVSEKQRNRLLQSKLTVSENECQNLRRRINSSLAPLASTSARVETIVPLLAEVERNTAAVQLNDSKAVLSERQQPAESSLASRQQNRKVVRFGDADDATDDSLSVSKENAAVAGERRRRAGHKVHKVKNVANANDLDSSAGECKQQ